MLTITYIHETVDVMLNQKEKVALSLSDTQEIITQPIARQHIKRWNSNQLGKQVPMEELRVLRAVVKLQNATADLASLWHWHRLCHTKTWQSAQRIVKERHAVLNALVERGGKYRESFNKIMGIDSNEKVNMR